MVYEEQPYLSTWKHRAKGVEFKFPLPVMFKTIEQMIYSELLLTLQWQIHSWNRKMSYVIDNEVLVIQKIHSPWMIRPCLSSWAFFHLWFHDIFEWSYLQQAILISILTIMVSADLVCFIPFASTLGMCLCFHAVKSSHSQSLVLSILGALQRHPCGTTSLVWNTKGISRWQV